MSTGRLNQPLVRKFSLHLSVFWSTNRRQWSNDTLTYASSASLSVGYCTLLGIIQLNILINCVKSISVAQVVSMPGYHPCSTKTGMSHSQFLLSQFHCSQIESIYFKFQDSWSKRIQSFNFGVTVGKKKKKTSMDGSKFGLTFRCKRVLNLLGIFFYTGKLKWQRWWRVVRAMV